MEFPVTLISFNTRKNCLTVYSQVNYVKDDSRLLWLLLSSSIAIIALIASIQQMIYISGLAGLVSAAVTIYAFRKGRSETRSDRFLEKAGYLLVEMTLLAALVISPVVPKWLAIVGFAGVIWAELLPELFRRIFKSQAWLTMGREVRIALLGAGVATSVLREVLAFYMTVIYVGACAMDAFEILYRVRSQKG